MLRELFSKEEDSDRRFEKEITAIRVEVEHVKNLNER
jgi:hypothetical protein